MPQPVDSPPPKPPRRRYSDQISVSSLGTHSTSKKHDENILKNGCKANISNTKPTYLSLPSKLTSNPVTEFDTSTLVPHCLNLSDQLKFYGKIESLSKVSTDKYLCLQAGSKQILPSLNTRCDNKEKFKCTCQEANSDHAVSKSLCRNFNSCSVDKLLSSIICSNPHFARKCDDQSKKPANIYCHRRYHSDSAVSYFNVSNPSPLPKSDIQHCPDNISFSTKKFKKCDSRIKYCCCKKNYFILHEIQSLKEINEKLWHNLCTVQSCFENMKKKTLGKSAEVSVSSLLSSIYYAQKAKDNAMEERLKIAFEERDSAFLELENIIYIFSKSFDATDALQNGGNKLDQETIDLLDEIGCSLNPSSLLKYQKMLLTHLHRLKTSKQDDLSYEIKCAIAERNDAMEKVRKLEEEIKGLKMCFDLWHLDNKHWELTLFDVLHQLIRQRDNISKVDNNLDIDSVTNRMPVDGTDSPERHLISQYLPRSESCNSHQLDNYKHSNTFDKSEENIKLHQEIMYLNTALEDERSKREQAERKCLRLERLIHTLRIKMNGQNIGVPI